MSEDGETIMKMLRLNAMNMAMDDILDYMKIIDADLLEEIMAEHPEQGDTIFSQEGLKIGEDMLILFRDFKRGIDALRDRAEKELEKEKQKSESARNN